MISLCDIPPEYLTATCAIVFSKNRVYRLLCSFLERIHNRIPHKDIILDIPLLHCTNVTIRQMNGSTEILNKLTVGLNKNCAKRHIRPLYVNLGGDIFGLVYLPVWHSSAQRFLICLAFLIQQICCLCLAHGPQ